MRLSVLAVFGLVLATNAVRAEDPERSFGPDERRILTPSQREQMRRELREAPSVPEELRLRRAQDDQIEQLLEELGRERKRLDSDREFRREEQRLERRLDREERRDRLDRRREQRRRSVLEQ